VLRACREDFARLMREQGIAANATPRMIRGRNRGKTRDAIYRARQRGASNLVRERVTDIAKQLMLTGSFHDPARAKLLETVAYIRRAGVCADLLDDALMDHESVIFQFITTSARSAGARYGRSRHPVDVPVIVDNDLLDLQEYAGISITRPGQFRGQADTETASP
jgi:hypothetical protein